MKPHRKSRFSLRTLFVLLMLFIAWLLIQLRYKPNPELKLDRNGDSHSLISERGGPARLEDGVYPVLGIDVAQAIKNDPEGEIIDLAEVPVPGSAKTPATIRIAASPLVRFQDVSNFDFKFENNQCTQLRFKNTDLLKAYTRDHVGSRLAIVVGRRVITHHKIREPITTEDVRVTFCTEGGGEHLRTHFDQLKTLR